ncbi:MAG: hypothetical protein FWF45_00575 [Coriobacteriia bacterium]|nr:hypothetical protein [Coriobacteriia bacterium]
MKPVSHKGSYHLYALEANDIESLTVDDKDKEKTYKQGAYVVYPEHLEMPVIGAEIFVSNDLKEAKEFGLAYTEGRAFVSFEKRLEQARREAKATTKKPADIKTDQVEKDDENGGGTTLSAETAHRLQATNGRSKIY